MSNKNMKKIYLAIPYSHPDSDVMQKRFEVANMMAGMLMNMGYLVFSPISHSHPIEQALIVNGGIKRPWEFWKKQDESFVRWCDEVYVGTVEGWKESVGVNAEIKIAQELNKPIFFINSDNFEVLSDEEMLEKIKIKNL
jgi:hypothetical protein